MKLYEYCESHRRKGPLTLIFATGCSYFVVFDNERETVKAIKCTEEEYQSQGWDKFKDSEMEEVFYILSLL